MRCLDMTTSKGYEFGDRIYVNPRWSSLSISNRQSFSGVGDILLQPCPGHAFSSFVAMWWAPTIITYILQRVYIPQQSRHSGWRTRWPINNYAWASSVIYWRFVITVFHMLSCIQWRASEKTRPQKPMLLAKPIFFLYGSSDTGSETFTVSYSSSAHWVQPLIIDILV